MALADVSWTWQSKLIILAPKAVMILDAEPKDLYLPQHGFQSIPPPSPPSQPIPPTPFQLPSGGLPFFWGALYLHSSAMLLSSILPITDYIRFFCRGHSLDSEPRVQVMALTTLVWTSSVKVSKAGSGRLHGMTWLLYVVCMHAVPVCVSTVIFGLVV